jgi:hypothetical protein
LNEFQAFLREYPRSLEERPRLTRRSGHHEWTDVTLGSRPANAVTQCRTRNRYRARKSALIQELETVGAGKAVSSRNAYKGGMRAAPAAAPRLLRCDWSARIQVTPPFGLSEGKSLRL